MPEKIFYDPPTNCADGKGEGRAAKSWSRSFFQRAHTKWIETCTKKIFHSTSEKKLQQTTSECCESPQKPVLCKSVSTFTWHLGRQARILIFCSQQFTLCFCIIHHKFFHATREENVEKISVSLNNQTERTKNSRKNLRSKQKKSWANICENSQGPIGWDVMWWAVEVITESSPPWHQIRFAPNVNLFRLLQKSSRNPFIAIMRCKRSRAHLLTAPIYYICLVWISASLVTAKFMIIRVCSRQTGKFWLELTTTFSRRYVRWLQSNWNISRWIIH